MLKSQFVVKDVTTSSLHYLSNEKECDDFFDDHERPFDLQIISYKED